MASRTNKERLAQAFERLEKELPDWLARFVHRMRGPRAHWVRIPLGVLFVAAGFFWFLPILGVEFLPIGLMLLAQDVPFLRRPMAAMMEWLLDRWDTFKAWWRKRRAARRQRRRSS